MTSDVTRHDDVEPDGVIWVGGPPTVERIDVVEPDPAWPAQYEELTMRVRRALGDTVLEISHVGSTSVPGLPAKPIIDVDLTVPDSTDEATYVPRLERAGFTLRLREPNWHGHRMLVAWAPRANVHVWSPGSPEVIRHRMFRDWLQDHANDRSRYAAAKRDAAAAANAAGETVMDYNLRKQQVIREILDEMFREHGML